MTVKQTEKELLDLIAKYTFLTDCKDNGLLDLGIYSNILFRLNTEDMERIKYYIQRIDEQHNDMRAFLDNAKEGGLGL